MALVTNMDRHPDWKFFGVFGSKTELADRAYLYMRRWLHLYILPTDERVEIARPVEELVTISKIWDAFVECHHQPMPKLLTKQKLSTAMRDYRENFLITSLFGADIDETYPNRRQTFGKGKNSIYGRGYQR